MTSKQSTLFVLGFCILGFIISLIGVVYGIKSINSNIDYNDLIMVNGRLTDAPYLKSERGGNAITNLVLSFDKFLGYKLKTPKECFEDDNLTFILNKTKTKSSVEIGLLKQDYKLLTSNNRPWGLIEGFKNSKKLRFMPIYYLKTKGKTLLTPKDVYKEIRKDGFINIIGAGFFLLIFTLGFNEVRKQKMNTHNIN